MSTITTTVTYRSPLAAVAFFAGAAAVVLAVLVPGLGMLVGLAACLGAVAASVESVRMQPPARAGYVLGMVGTVAGFWFTIV